MRILDQDISFVAHQQSLIRVQKSEQQESFVGGRLVQQQAKSLDSLTTQSATYRHNAPQPNSSNHLKEDRSYLPDKDHAKNSRGAILANQENSTQGINSSVNNINRDRVTLSNSALPLEKTADVQQNKVTLPPYLLKMIEVVEAMMEKLSGKKTTLQVYGYHNPKQTDEDASSLALNAQGTVNNNMALGQTDSPPLDQRVTPEQMNLQGSRLTYSESYHEMESTRFSASGTVQTADGKSIHFELNTQMSRQFYSASQVQMEEGFILQDPLVVNFGGQPASLTVEKVKFDLDSDGDLENMSFLNSGSGFLAFDKNQDGLINNGNELFGTQSGDGFADLKQYDEDQNGWIDENDTIFSQLQIWHKNSQGMDELSGLLNLNIGAIYLQNIDSPFTFKDHTNQTQGQVVSSGIFLSEDGSVGSVQQIDLAV